MEKDRLLIAGIIGGLSTVTGEIATKLLVLCGLGQYGLFELDSLVITLNRPNMLMGFVVNIIVGYIIGVLFYLFLKKYGRQHAVIKIIGGSLLMWMLFELEFTGFIESKFVPIRPIADYFVHLAGSAVYGLAVGILFKLLLFNDKKKTG